MSAGLCQRLALLFFDMKKLTITVFAFSVLSCQSQQRYFNKVYDFNNMYDFFSCHTELQNGDIFLSGRSIQFPVKDYGLIYKIDTYGNELYKAGYDYNAQSSNYGTSYYGLVTANSIGESPYTGNIVMTGAIYDSVEHDMDLFLHTFTQNGDSLWFRNLDAGYLDWGQKILFDTDSGMLVIGYKEVNWFDTSLVVIIKTDSIGNKLWQREYGLPDRVNQAINCIHTRDGGYLISGRRNDDSNQNRNLMLMKIDSVFNEVWVKTYDTGNLDYPGWYSNLIETSDGYIMVGQREYLSFVLNRYHTKGLLLKTDKYGNQIWLKQFDEPFWSYYFKGIIEQAENEFIILGAKSIDTGISSGSNALLIKADSATNIIWQREYNYWNDINYEQSLPYNLTRSENGDLIFSGYSIYNPHPTKNNGWVVKTDSCGYTEGDVSIAQIQLDTLIDKTIMLQNTSPAYCSWQWHFGDGDSSSIRNPTHTYNDTGSYTTSLVTRAGNDWDTASMQVHVADTSTVNSPQSTAVSAQMRLYPNPASEYIILSGYIPENITGAKAEFYDMQGRLVKTETLKSGLVNRSISTRGFTMGVYAYRVFSNEANIATGRIFIEP